MITANLTRFVGVAVLLLVLLLGTGGLTLADAPPPDFILELPAGSACQFDLKIEGRGGSQVYKEFVDKNGELVRSLSAGKGSALTFINEDTGATLELKSNGAVIRTTYRKDGTQEVVVTGHNVLILFPTDIPAGPSTTLYVGRVVYTVDPNGVFMLQSTSGRSTDICAALASGG